MDVISENKIVRWANLDISPFLEHPEAFTLEEVIQALDENAVNTAGLYFFAVRNRIASVFNLKQLAEFCEQLDIPMCEPNLRAAERWLKSCGLWEEASPALPSEQAVEEVILRTHRMLLPERTRRERIEKIFAFAGAPQAGPVASTI